MQYAQYMPTILVAITAYTTFVTTSFGQDFKKGDKVIALSNATLMIGAETIGTINKGEELTVEEVKDNWLWVRKAKIGGWINGGKDEHREYRVVWGLEGCWMITSSKPGWAVIKFTGNTSGSGIKLQDAGEYNTSISWEPWRFDGRTISWTKADTGNRTIDPWPFNVKLQGQWKIKWKNRDEMEGTDSDGNTMKFVRNKEQKK